MKTKTRPPSLSPFQSAAKPKYRWRVRFTENGKRRSKLFELKKDATDELNKREVEFRNLGSQVSGMLTDQLKREAVEASERLSEVNATITEAVDYFLNHVAARKRSKDITEAVEDWLKVRRSDGTRPRTLGNLESRSKRLVESFAGRLVAEITEDDIHSWLEGIEGTAQTKKHHRAVAGVFFTWAKFKKLTDANPVSGVPIPKVEATDPEVFTPKQMREMLKTASEKSPKLVAYLVLCGFAGLRAEEAERLRWEHIDFHHKSIDISPTVSKTRQGRDVPLEANASEWLKPIRKDQGPILPEQWLSRQVLRDFKAGLGYEWPANGLRHSYGSYHLYRGMDAGKTAMAMGHNGNPQMLFRHYRKKVKRTAAREWFRIKPKATGAKIIKMEAAVNE